MSYLYEANGVVRVHTLVCRYWLQFPFAGEAIDHAGIKAAFGECLTFLIYSPDKGPTREQLLSYVGKVMDRIPEINAVEARYSQNEHGVVVYRDWP